MSKEFECRYCGSRHNSTEQLTRHLVERHDRDELSRIDRKRIEKYEQSYLSQFCNELSDAPLSRRTTITAAGVVAGVVVGVGGIVSAQNDPIAIADWYDLNDVRNGLSDDYELANDLTPDTDGYEAVVENPTDGFEPIGGPGDPFTGMFNGRGNTIAGLQIERAEDNLGLFGVVEDNGVIRNVVLENVDISQQKADGEHVGGLFGVNRGEVRTSFVTGNVSSTSTEGDTYTSGSRAGGLGGNNNRSGIVSECAADVIVDAPDGSENGGLIGIILGSGGTVSDSYALGSVSGENDTGGLVGLNFGNIRRSYAAGAVRGAATRNGTAGGLVGLNDETAEETVENSYWDRGATGQSEAIGQDGGGGGEFGDLSSETVENSYWDRRVTGQAEAVGERQETNSSLVGFGDPSDTAPADEMQGINPTRAGDNTMGAFAFKRDGGSTWVAVVSGEKINPIPQDDGYPILQTIGPEPQLNRQGISFKKESDDGMTIIIRNSTIADNGGDGVRIGESDDD